MRYVFNVIASVGRQNDVYRPIKLQKIYRPTVFFNVIAAKVADQLRGNREADQRLCFRYTDSTISLVPISHRIGGNHERSF